MILWGHKIRWGLIIQDLVSEDFFICNIFCLLTPPALHQEGLFRVNGNVRAVETLKQHLEGGGDVNLLSESDSCTVASLLKQYLRDLPGGLVVMTVQQALIQHYQGKSPTCSPTFCAIFFYRQCIKIILQHVWVSVFVFLTGKMWSCRYYWIHLSSVM